MFSRQKTEINWKFNFLRRLIVLGSLFEILIYICKSSYYFVKQLGNKLPIIVAKWHISIRFVLCFLYFYVYKVMRKRWAIFIRCDSKYQDNEKGSCTKISPRRRSRIWNFRSFLSKLSYKSAIVQTRRGINLNFRLQDTTLQSSKKYPDSVKNSRACHVT